MNEEQEKTTAPSPSVGADGEQPISETVSNIPDSAGDYNPAVPDLYSYFREMERMSDPSYLYTVTMEDLFETVYDGRPEIIEGLLHTGVYLLSGSPKVGKSFFMLQMAYHVSMGLPLWGHTVRKGAVLYLALEDDYQRLQARLDRMYGVDNPTRNLHLATCAHKLGEGLEEQLKGFLQDHPDTRLIIVDVLKMIRDDAASYSYSEDYAVIQALREAVTGYPVAMVVVHHNRKEKADDPFEMISGTNGLFGASDGGIVLCKAKRTDRVATLDITGRDQQDQKLFLQMDMEHLTWELEREEAELWKEPPDPLLEEVSKLVTEEQPAWSGTPTELASLIPGDYTPNGLSMRLNVRAARLLEGYQIRYEPIRTHDSRRIKLTLIQSKA